MRYRLLLSLLVALACMPGAKVVAKAPLRVEVVIAAGGAHTVYLDNIWSLCERDRRQCRKNVDDFITNVSGTMKEASAELKAADIRVVVRTADYVAQARKMAEGRPDHATLARPVAGDLWMICVGDAQHGIHVVQRGTCKAWPHR